MNKLNNKIQKITGMSEKVFNKYKMYTYWGLFVCITISVGMYFYFNQHDTKVKTEQGEISIDEEVKKQIALLEKKPKTKEIRSTNFFCPANVASEVNFSSTDILKYPLRVIYIVPDSNYITEHTGINIENYLNQAWDPAKMAFKLVKEERAIYSEITSKVVKSQEFLNLYSSYDYITLIIFPKKTIFDAELSKDRKKKIKHLYGKANGIGDVVAFIREEVALSGINIHELAHLFNLRHLHAGNLPKVSQGYSCDLGDEVYDTPATGSGFYVLEADGGCRYDANDPDATEKEKMVIYSNYMAYTNIVCMAVDTVGFTPEQISRMRAFTDVSLVHRDMLLDSDDYDFVISNSNQLFLE